MPMIKDDRFTRKEATVLPRRMTADEKAKLRGIASEKAWSIEQLNTMLGGAQDQTPRHQVVAIAPTLPGPKQMRPDLKLISAPIRHQNILGIKVAFNTGWGKPKPQDVLTFVQHNYPGHQIVSGQSSTGCLDIILREAAEGDPAAPQQDDVKESLRQVLARWEAVEDSLEKLDREKGQALSQAGDIWGKIDQCKVAINGALYGLARTGMADGAESLLQIVDEVLRKVTEVETTAGRPTEPATEQSNLDLVSFDELYGMLTGLEKKISDLGGVAVTAQLQPPMPMPENPDQQATPGGPAGPAAPMGAPMDGAPQGDQQAPGGQDANNVGQSPEQNIEDLQQMLQGAEKALEELKAKQERGETTLHGQEVVPVDDTGYSPAPPMGAAASLGKIATKPTDLLADLTLRDITKYLAARGGLEGVQSDSIRKKMVELRPHKGATLADLLAELGGSSRVQVERERGQERIAPPGLSQFKSLTPTPDQAGPALPSNLEKFNRGLDKVLKTRGLSSIDQLSPDEKRKIELARNSIEQVQQSLESEDGGPSNKVEVKPAESHFTPNKEFEEEAKAAFASGNVPPELKAKAEAYDNSKENYYIYLSDMLSQQFNTERKLPAYNDRKVKKIQIGDKERPLGQLSDRVDFLNARIKDLNQYRVLLKTVQSGKPLDPDSQELFDELGGAAAANKNESTLKSFKHELTTIRENRPSNVKVGPGGFTYRSMAEAVSAQMPQIYQKLTSNAGDRSQTTTAPQSEIYKVKTAPESEVKEQQERRGIPVRPKHGELTHTAGPDDPQVPLYRDDATPLAKERRPVGDFPEGKRQMGQPEVLERTKKPQYNPDRPDFTQVTTDQQKQLDEYAKRTVDMNQAYEKVLADPANAKLKTAYDYLNNQIRKLTKIHGLSREEILEANPKLKGLDTAINNKLQSLMASAAGVDPGQVNPENEHRQAPNLFMRTQVVEPNKGITGKPFRTKYNFDALSPTELETLQNFMEEMAPGRWDIRSKSPESILKELMQGGDPGKKQGSEHEAVDEEAKSYFKQEYGPDYGKALTEDPVDKTAAGMKTPKPSKGGEDQVDVQELRDEASEHQSPARAPHLPMKAIDARQEGVYTLLTVEWDSKHPAAERSHYGMMQAVRSFVKGLESKKEFGDLGFLGKIIVADLDLEDGTAVARFRTQKGADALKTFITRAQGKK